MSDFDHIDDDDELENLNEDNLSAEDIFSMVLLNKNRGTKVTMQLEDQDGDVVELSDIVESLVDYLIDKISESDTNNFNSQIMPMMSQALVSGLGKLIGIRGTAFYLAQENTRHSMIHMMSIGFLLLKYIQEHKLVINTIEEEISEEEINEIERKSSATSIATMGSIMGMNPREILQKMVDQGQITDDDLNDIFNKEDPSE